MNNKKYLDDYIGLLMRFKFILSVCLIAFLTSGMLLSEAHAKERYINPVGKYFANTLSINYKTIGNALRRVDTTVLTSEAVKQRSNPDLSEDSATVTTGKNSTIVFYQTLYNKGNSADSFNITARSLLNWDTKIYQDINKNGILDDAEKIDFSFVENLDTSVNDTIGIFLEITIPDSVTNNLVDTIYLNAIPTYIVPEMDTSLLIIQIDLHPPEEVTLITENDTYINYDTLQLEWQGASDTDIKGYLVNIASDSIFTDTQISQIDYHPDTGAEFDISQLIDGIYYWHVLAFDTYDNYNTGVNIRKFTIDRTPPTKPVLLAPIDTEYFSDTVDFEFTQSSDALSGIRNYRLNIVDMFNSTVADSTIADTNFQMYFENEGIYYWNIAAYDSAGNYAYSDTQAFAIDRTVPSAEIMINNDSQFTNSRNVQITITGSSDIEYIKLSEKNDLADTSFINFTSPINFVLTDEDTTHYVYALVKDIAGNTSAIVFDTIILDRIAPRIIDFNINQDSSFTDNINVVLYINADSDVYKMRIKNSESDYTQWLDYEDTYNWTLTQSIGIKTVYLQIMDQAGNISTESDTIIYSSPSIYFDKEIYHSVSDIANITLTDFSMNKNSYFYDNVIVKIISDYDQTGINLTLTETERNSGIFKAGLEFTNGLSEDNKKISVNPDNTVKVIYTRDLSFEYSDTCIWKISTDDNPIETLDKVRNWPNPFVVGRDPYIVIQNLPSDPQMTIAIYTINNELVKTLYTGKEIEYYASGNIARWSGRNSAGRYVASGIYLYVVKSSKGVIVRKITLIK